MVNERQPEDAKQDQTPLSVAYHARSAAAQCCLFVGILFLSIVCTGEKAADGKVRTYFRPSGPTREEFAEEKRRREAEAPGILFSKPGQTDTALGLAFRSGWTASFFCDHLPILKTSLASDPSFEEIDEHNIDKFIGSEFPRWVRDDLAEELFTAVLQ